MKSPQFINLGSFLPTPIVIFPTLLGIADSHSPAGDMWLRMPLVHDVLTDRLLPKVVLFGLVLFFNFVKKEP